MPDRSGSSDAGSCAYDDIDTTEVCSVAGGSAFGAAELVAMMGHHVMARRVRGRVSDPA